jgi:acetolactate synthase-1/2/3 large subunit
MISEYHVRPDMKDEARASGSTMADAIVARLRAAGVLALFGVPGGGGNLDIIEAARRAGLPFVLTTTETGGALAAMAQAEVTGCPGACLTTLGPGAASVINGIACAWLDRAPVIVFTDTQPGVAEHQRLDHAALLRSIVKSSAPLNVRTGTELLDRAIEASMSDRPGPVHLDCPGDVVGGSSEPGNEPESAPGHGALASRRVDASATQFDGSLGDLRVKLGARLRAAKKPMLLVGLGARRAGDAMAIRSLCADRGIPAMVTYKAKGAVPDDHEWFAGVLTNGSIERTLLDESDLLIGLGLDPVELLPRAWPSKPPLFLFGPWHCDEQHVKPEIQCVIDIPSTVAMLREGFARSSWIAADVRASVQTQHAAIWIAATGMTAQDAVRAAATQLSRSHRVTVDAGAHMLPATMLWPVREPNGMLISNGLSTMGFALPAAIGAALADPTRPVVALTGDGGLLMCLGELLTAAREALQLIVIVFDDASLSLIEIKQQARELPAAGVALGGVDWPALAASMGVAGFSASTPEQLSAAIEQALAVRGPSLIDAKIDRSNYGATLKAIRG